MNSFTYLERNALAKAISLYQEYPGFEPPKERGMAWVIGITGAPGVGKSTLINPLIKHFRKEDLRVVVLAIDPSSKRDGSAILSDRTVIRDQDLDHDKGLFFRSLASRATSSALTVALPKIVAHARLMADIVIVETAGAGQSDVDIDSIVDSLLLVLAPLEGPLNLEKAGLNEHAHIFAVNDRESFTATRKFFATASLELAKMSDDGWTKKVFLLNALRKTGIDEFVKKGLLAHKEFIKNKKPAD